MTKMTDRRTEQLARVAGFLFMAPPTDPKYAMLFASHKARKVYPAPERRVIFAASRMELDAYRKAHEGVRVEYVPHQNTRECARRKAA